MRYAAPLTFFFALSLIGCDGGGQSVVEPTSWQEHSDRLRTNSEVVEAINEPDGGNYARAIEIIRLSDRPDDAKKFEIAQLIIGSYAHKDSRRPSQSLQQGVEMFEQVAVDEETGRRFAPQRLRLMFERGVGLLPEAIPVDPVVADCWHKIETGHADDPKKCVALRRERLPQLSS